MTRFLARAGAVAAAALLPLTVNVAAANADTPGHAPTWVYACGAYRDIPSQWTSVSGDNPCQGYGYSYVWTSPSHPHSASWDLSSTSTAVGGTFEVDTWIPAKYAGALAEYDYQICGSSTWHVAGTLNQEADNSDQYGWYKVGTLSLQANQAVCTVKVHNVGSGSWDLAEDALGLYAL